MSTFVNIAISSRKKLLANSLIKNFAFLTAAEIFSKILTFAAFAYLARLFGPAGFGNIEWAATALMCAGLVVDQGFSAFGAREIARSPSDTQKLVTEIVTARFLLAAFSYAVILASAIWLVQDRKIAQLLMIYGLSLWALPFLLQWVFQGHDRMHLVAVTQVIRQTVFVSVVVVFVRGTGELLWVGVAEVAAVTSASVFSILVYRRLFGEHKFSRPALSGKIFREGVPIGLSQMFWVIRMFGATFILGLVATAEDTGYFAGAMRIYIALHTFVWLYYFNMLPTLSRMWKEGSDKLAGEIRRSIRLVSALSLIGGVIWIAAAPMVMATVYGPEFSRGGAALQWLAGACIAAALSGHYRYGLIAAGHQRQEMLATGVGSVCAMILIPIGYLKAGIGGAAAALLAAECVVLACSWLIARRSLFARAGETLVAGKSPLTTLPEAMQ